MPPPHAPGSSATSRGQQLLLAACACMVFYDIALRGGDSSSSSSSCAGAGAARLGARLAAAAAPVSSVALSASASAASSLSGGTAAAAAARSVAAVAADLPQFSASDYYNAIERKFDLLDSWTRRSHENYRDRKWSMASISRYAGVKTRFIFETLTAAFAPSASVTVCELGFNAGHSSLLFLETLPNARIVSFDLGETSLEQENKDLLKSVYGARFEYVQGDSADTMPRFVGKLLCDVAFADGYKSFAKRYGDMQSFRKLSRKGALAFLDEVSDGDCASGRVPEARCTFNSSHFSVEHDYSEESRAYNRLVAEKAIVVDSCVETPTPGDGFCLARFL